jgi:hypothetical protein
LTVHLTAGFSVSYSMPLVGILCYNSCYIFPLYCIAFLLSILQCDWSQSLTGIAILIMPFFHYFFLAPHLLSLLLI